MGDRGCGLRQAETSNNKQEPEINKKIKVTKETVSPLAIFTFSNDEIKNLASSIYQSYIEDKISLEFSKQLILLAQQTQPDSFSKIRDSVNAEVNDCENILDLIETLALEKETFDKALFDRDAATIDALARKNFDSLNPDGLNESLNFFGSIDSENVLAKLSDNALNVSLKTNSAIAIQLLQVASYTMIHGMSPVICNKKMSFNNQQNSVSSEMFIGKEIK